MCYSNCPFEKTVGYDQLNQVCTFDPRIDNKADMHCFSPVDTVCPECGCTYAIDEDCPTPCPDCGAAN